FDQKEINRQFTKISWEVKNAESIPVMTRRGFKVAATQPGGPVYLAYADYALETKDVKSQILPAENFMIPSRIKAAPDQIEKMAKMLVEADNPVMLFGDEVWKSGAHEKAVELAELLAIPSVAAREAFRSFPTHHPLCIGRYSPGAGLMEKTVDLLVTFGTKDFGANRMMSVEDAPKIIRCGIDTSKIGRTFPFELAVVGCVKEIM
ncbi:MAG: thiamine pyrophosphate-binding protein, partial [Proteobacteria bacterium]|nr:thiamine pyrophosphate-binding protein [Pseudomonadota bacterium]